MQLRGWGFTLFYDTMWKGVDKTTVFAWQSIYVTTLLPVKESLSCRTQGKLNKVEYFNLKSPILEKLDGKETVKPHFLVI